MIGLLWQFKITDIWQKFTVIILTPKITKLVSILFLVDEEEFDFNHMSPEMDFMSFAEEMNLKIDGGWMRKNTLEKVMGDMEETMSVMVL